MKKYKIAVLYGHGINCDRETVSALSLASKRLGVEGKVGSERVHTNQFISQDKELGDYLMLVIPGGFLHGDDISAGRILASKLKNKLEGQIKDFVSEGKLILGICNGFQVLVKYPLLPYSEGAGTQTVSLIDNDSGRFEDRWVNLAVPENSRSVFLDGIKNLRLPIRHAEGKFVGRNELLEDLSAKGQIGLRYSDREGRPAEKRFPENPNGSYEDIAAISNESGRIFGLMPHPEAFISPYQNPEWDIQKRNDQLQEVGSGLKIFENAVEFLLEEF